MPIPLHDVDDRRWRHTELPLEGRGVDAETVESLRDLLTRCDFARFAPTESSPADMAEARRLAGELVEGLELWI